MNNHVVCTADELPPGNRKTITIGSRSVVVFNVDGQYYGVRNTCPHQGAPLCMGSVAGTMLPSSTYEYVYGMEGMVLRCPWHGWEFDLSTGRSLFDPQGVRVATYPVRVADGLVILEA